MNKYQIHLAAALLLGAATFARGELPVAISPDNPLLKYGGYVNKEVVASTDGTKVLRFDRTIDMPSKGYRWDNPGVTIQFRTDATEIEAVLDYTSLHTSTSARNAVGVYSIDGVFKREWSFKSRQRDVFRQPETVVLSLTPETPGVHDYQLYLPYGDSVDFAGLRLPAAAKLEAAAAKPMPRYVAYGDSITHGFSSSRISKTYPFLVGQSKGWETINLGLGGRSSTPDDGKLVASLKADVITVLMGANDWQVGVPVERYRSNMTVFLNNIRSKQAGVPIYLITSLWVNDSWKPAGKVADLEAYRQVLRELVATLKDPHLHLLEGPELIDTDPKLYDQAPIHPSDAGFAMMAERMAQKISDLKK
ncbi:MAG TPA: GDSL-type esterase/lipase family protein [Rariglobus sp.]|nr:GDSL-type esterase/lipase family protein [Rariglobus sp.]